jgi:Fic family protein
MPSPAAQEPLLAKAHDLALAASSLAHHPIAQHLRGLLRVMNSYYTNRIEGQHTRPSELEQALRQDFSNDARLAAKQRLAVAHIDAEIELEQRYRGEAGARALYSPGAVCDLHRTLFARLPAQDLQAVSEAPIVPGQWRQREVSVGRHVAPVASSIEAFVARWATVYGPLRRGEAMLVGMAAAHQRLGWIHPFIDGNGRVMRLHTHVVLTALGYTGGLWSPLRGFARSVDRYYALLAAADEPRRGDLDGRGNLSEAALVDWVDYTLDVCLDQVGFMEALRPLHYLLLTATDLERGEFKRMTGLGERTAVKLLSALLARGLLHSESPQGKLRFGVPLHALRFYFPALWPEAEADMATGQGG